MYMDTLPCCKRRRFRVQMCFLELDSVNIEAIPFWLLQSNTHALNWLFEQQLMMNDDVHA